ncbi:hypothetical protein LJC27_06925 [Christensenellaceae bacterium OttesenSCG-928-M15]|nr:hypothetical protein [Christensenellaceae bacterium OttesenSCG-928-M15]
MENKQNKEKLPYLNVSFIFKSLFGFFILFILGNIFTMPLFQAIFGGSVNATFLYPIYWGVCLLAGFVALCTYIIVDAIHESALAVLKKTDNEEELPEADA